jgi:galactokinase
VAVKARVKAWRAPGRVNLIGEHTDYNDGFVLPCALGLESQVRVKSTRKKELRIHSAEIGAEVAWPIESLKDLAPQGNWTDYCIGVAKELLALGFEIKPAKLEIHSTVPSGSGLSSSAALEVSTALALLDGRPIEKIDLARLCQRAERNFVGMPCGIMDQYVSVFGVAHAAICIDCRSLDYEVVPLPDGVEIIAVNSMVKHDLGKSEYPLRVAQCKEALSHFPGKTALRDVTLGDLERTAKEIPEVPLARARHIVLENFRVRKFLEAAAAKDLQAMGRLFVESHRSLQHDYQVSCPELDFLVDTALTVSGVYGARMTGGGFGGCTVNLVDAGAVANFDSAVNTAYQAKFGKTPTVYRCNPSAGAGPCNESASSSR